jgi:hypothetical protein
MKAWLFILPLAAVVLLALGVLAFQLLDSPTRIDYYRLGDDDRTLIVGTTSGPHAWVRVTNVSETPTAVTITVRTFFVQLGPSTALGYPYESTVTLDAPLDGRSVMDGTSGMLVQRAKCAPPALSASPCP